MTKPVFMLSLTLLGDHPGSLEDATARLEAAGYVVVPHMGPNAILAPPTPDARTLLAGMVLQGLLSAVEPFAGTIHVDAKSVLPAAVRMADELLKELAK